MTKISDLNQILTANISQLTRIPVYDPSETIPTQRTKYTTPEQLALMMGYGVPIKYFGAVSDGVTDDTDAVNTGIAELNDRGGGVLIYPPGVTRLHTTTLLSSVSHIGTPGASQIKKFASTNYMFLTNEGNGGSTSDTSTNIKDILFFGLTIVGNSQEVSMSEQTALFCFCGTSNVLIDFCNLKAFEGDAITFIASTTGSVERHNENIGIRNSTFDGVNYNSRNGISVCEGSNILMDNLQLTRIGHPSMPGAIDLEPYQIFHKLKNIYMTNIGITDCPDIAGLSFAFLPQSVINTPQQNFVVENFAVDGCKTGWALSGECVSTGPTELTEPYEVTLKTGRITNCTSGFAYDGAMGVHHEKVTYESCSGISYLGYTDSFINRNVKHLGIKILNCARVSTDAWQIKNFNHLTIEKCEFDNNGVASGGGVDLHFMTGCAGAELFHNYNTYKSTTPGITTYVVKKDAGFTLDGNSSQDKDNLVYFASNYDIVARFSRQAAAPVTGTWSAGATVYNSNPQIGSPYGWVYSSVSSNWRPFGILT